MSSVKFHVSVGSISAGLMLGLSLPIVLPNAVIVMANPFTVTAELVPC